jgi:prephenate dehydrogenase
MPTFPVIQHDDASADRPPFERIAIVGLGLMGGSLALAIRRRWRGGLIIGVDRKDALEAGMRMHAVDVGADDLGMAAEADLIVLAAPVRQNIAVLNRLPEVVAGRVLVTDIGSTKREILREARTLPDRLTFVGGHPLAGAAATGISWAVPHLFDTRPWLLATPAPEEALSRLEALVRGVGSIPVRMDADRHDTLLAFLSHLPQLTASALMHVVGERAGAEGLTLAGRGLRDTTRLALSSPEIWRDITATNAADIEEALDLLIAALEQLRADLRSGDDLLRIFESAARWKRLLEGSAGEPGI